MTDQTIYPKTLEESDNRALVQLSACYEHNKITDMLADLTPAGADFLKRTPDFALSFNITAQQADAFVVAWQEFRQEQHRKEMVEMLRQEKAKQEAFKIAEAYSEIAIEDKTCTDGSPAWVVTIPCLDWNMDVPKWSYDGVDLLNTVKEAKEAWDEHEQRRVAKEEALRLIETTPGISFTPDRSFSPNPSWIAGWLYFRDESLGYKHNAQEVLEAIRTVADEADEEPVIRLQLTDGRIIS